jgi:5-methylcytosine-specific restriction endonuclease McrA
MKKGEVRPDLQRARIGICPICGEKFRAVKDFKNRKQIYCSKKCWNIRAKVVNKCKYCGKEIITTKSINKVYCNNECRNLDYRNTHKGELSYFWQGGKTKESKLRKTDSQYKEWRKKVFERDNYICQHCGNHTRDLEPHHIKEQCNYPGLIYDVDNGITLCHECHKKTDNYGYKLRCNNRQMGTIYW